ncbi:hypothetical protein [Asanoa iriomotensis]|uniref:Gram-positive cocci surface proteins LPxTG domain-containing protein n=1 Tax=Asanoa iriomotensis TaxID=234613 RepID=A0ABQ4C6U3_9ACTN|nr:hypothetical protein [Asanoa iriomotensis]GIF58508.1 hypothetical protein Air01nite_46030 [Asanoa iriomotensis]
MRRCVIRQLAAGCGAVLAAVLLAAPPALAAPEDIAINMRDVTVAVGHPGVVAGATLISASPVALDDVVVTYDFSALVGVAEVVAPGCALVDTTILGCARDEVRLGSAPLPGQFDVVVRAVDGAKVGEGPLQVGVSAAGRRPVFSNSWVRVGAGVDLVAGPGTELTRRPGEAFTFPLRVDVAGTTAVEKPNIYFTEVYAFRATRKFSNCLYVEDRIRNCWFDATFPPGAGYTAVLPFALGTDTAAPGTKSVEALWLTAAEAEDYETFLTGHGYNGGELGTDGELTLVPELTLRAATQADTVPANNRSTLSVAVTGQNGLDLAASGAAVHGAVGARVPALVGFRNHGPAAAEHLGGDVATVEVTIPPGTTATAVSPECAPLTDPAADGAPGAPAYRCRPGPLVRADFIVEFTFELRIDRAQPADGGVRLTGTEDLDATNDQAAITVNRAITTPPPAAARGLPITGAPAGLLAGLGTIMIVVGACAVVLARTRAG